MQMFISVVFIILSNQKQYICPLIEALTKNCDIFIYQNTTQKHKGQTIAKHNNIDGFKDITLNKRSQTQRIVHSMI